MSTFIRLFHGRATPDEMMDDWGSDGPVLGPLECVGATDGGLFLALPYRRIDLPFVSGLIFYDRVFYGDLDIFSAEAVDHAVLPREELAKPPKMWLGKRYEVGPIELRADQHRGFAERRSVFLDSLKEFAGDTVAQLAARCLNTVVQRVKDTRPLQASKPPSRRPARPDSTPPSGGNARPGSLKSWSG